MNREKLIMFATMGLVTGLVFSGLGAGSTPIQGLKLIGAANGNGSSFTNLDSVVASNIVATSVTVGGTNISSTLAGYVTTNALIAATNGLLSAVSGNLNFSVDGAGDVVVPCTNRTVLAYAQTIANWYVVSDVATTATVDVRTNGVSLVGSGNKPTLTASAASNAVATAWSSTVLPAGTVVQFVVTTNSAATQLNVVLGTTHR